MTGIMETMKAVLIEKPGGPETLKLSVITMPVAKPGQVLIRIKAFGINRAELYMRAGKWPEIAQVIGIECVGVVEEDPGGNFRKGQKVAAIMGGMGRSINGSYAEFTVVPVSNVIAIETNLSWDEFAAIPESFASAWGALQTGLNIKKGQTLLVRGASSAFGLAAIILAKQTGLTVIATTRSPDKEKFLKKMGADYVLHDNGKLHRLVKELYPRGVDRVLDLVGSTTLMNSAKLATSRGVVCMAGLLGGRTCLDLFQPLVERISVKKWGKKFHLRLPRGTRISFFASTVFGSNNFPVSEIPLQQIIKDIEEGIIPSILVRRYSFNEIATAHHHMESNAVNGKLVVLL